MKIAVLSDTHGLLRPEAAELILKCDAVIHAGDINSQKIIDEMKAAAKENAPIYIVRGNNDKEWAEHLPHHLEFTLAGMNFYVIHNKKELPSDLGDRQIIIFGHSHRYSEEKKDGRLWLNPAMLLVVLAVLGGIGALVYFKFIKQKPKTKGSDNLDDYDYGEEEELPEDETWETEPEDADGGGDEESENPAK